MAGSTDKTLKLYEGHFHDLLNDVDKEVVMADIQQLDRCAHSRGVSHESFGAWCF